MPLRPNTVERIKRETIDALRQATHNHTIDTGKVKQLLSEAEQRILQQVAPIQGKVDEHDGKIGELDNFITGLREAGLRALGGISKALKG